MSGIVAILKPKKTLCKKIQNRDIAIFFEFEYNKTIPTYNGSIYYDLKSLLNKIGIRTRCRDELHNKPFIN